jgi:hypothetical protein
MCASMHETIYLANHLGKSWMPSSHCGHQITMTVLPYTIRRHDPSLLDVRLLAKHWLHAGAKWITRNLKTSYLFKQHTMNLIKTLTLTLATALAGCSTAPIAIPKINGPAIVFVRDTGFFGGGCSFDVLIDGEIVGRLKAGQVVTKSVSKGKHRAAIDNATALCANVKMSKVVEVAGEPIVLRIGMTSNSQVIFDQVE